MTGSASGAGCGGRRERLEAAAGARRHLGRFARTEYLRERFCFWHPALDTISIVKYGEGIDERCGWDTHLVSIDDKAAVFTDGPLPGARLPGCIDGSHSFTWRMGLGTCRYCFEKKRQKEKSDG